MKRRPWIFKPSLIVAIAAALLVYSVLAELFVFHLLGPKLPTASILDHRLQECLYLWPVACLAVGWTIYFRKRRPERRASVWPLLAIPFFMAVWLATSEALDVYRDHVDDVNRGIPAT